METLIRIKNRYWLLILIVLLFLSRYYFEFVLKIANLEERGQDHNITFQTFFIYNYLLGLTGMLLFLCCNFLLLKGIAYMWQNLESKKIFKAILVSYGVFFIPNIISFLYFNLLNNDFHFSEIKAFRRAFYLRAETGVDDLFESNAMNSILSSVSLMEFAYFAVMIVVLQLLFEELSMKKIVPMVLILAAVHFASKTILPLMFS